MKISGMAKIPSGKVVIPAQHHLMLAKMFHQLAAMHQNTARMQGTDPTEAQLPSPDKTVKATRQGRPLFKQPLIGSPNSP